MSRTKEVALAIRDDLSQFFGGYRRNCKHNIESKIDALIAASVGWLIRKHRVQRVIADQFASGTPMCRVLDDAVESQVEDALRDRRIEAEDVHGLESAIGREIDDKLDSISSEHWFTDAVTDAVDSDKIAEAIVDDRGFIDEVADRVAEHSSAIADAVIAKLKEQSRKRRIERRLSRNKQQHPFEGKGGSLSQPI